GGVLFVTGSTTSNVTVATPGTLGGTGSITGTVSGSGTVAPGIGVGTLTITGSFTPTGTVSLDVNQPYATAGTDFDRLVVNGTANTVDLSGAVVSFVSTGG